MTLPRASLVLLIGPSGSGKTTFARRHFRPTQVLSSDSFRALLADDESDQTVSAEAFALLHAVTARRLAAGRLTVVDATNVQPDARRPLVDLAHAHGVQPVAIVLAVPEEVCLERDAARADRTVGPGVIRAQHRALRRWMAGLEHEGFASVIVLDRPEEIDQVEILPA